MSKRKLNLDSIMSQNDLENEAKDKYELLNKGLDEIINSSFYEELKDIKINITYRELQLDNIDNGISNIDIEALSKMTQYTSNLGVELMEVFDKELAKNPETARDNIVDLKETFDYNIDALKEKEDYIEDALLYAKSFNELTMSLIKNDDNTYDFDNLPEEVKAIFDKNEEVLFVTNEAIFKEDTFEYVQSIPSFSSDYDNNFESIKNDFDIVIESYRQLSEVGMDIGDSEYLKQKLNQTVEYISIYTIDDNHSIELRMEQFRDYIMEKDNYIEANIPNVDISLSNLVEEMRMDLEREEKGLDSIEKTDIEKSVIEADVEEVSIEDKEVETDYGGFEL